MSRQWCAAIGSVAMRATAIALPLNECVNIFRHLRDQNLHRSPGQTERENDHATGEDQRINGSSI